MTNQPQRISEITQAEAFLKSLPDCVTELPTEHYQIDGVYARVLHIPAGMCLVGKIHNQSHISILAQGTIRIDDGENQKQISAPFVGIDKAGIKRLGYALTDCVFINVLRTDKTDVSEIEREAVSDSFEEFEQRKLEAL